MAIMTYNPFAKPDYIPEDAESIDEEEISSLIERYMSEAYPEFEPEILSTFDKQYYLPALKVLGVKNGEFFSPSKEARWVDGELEAICQPSMIFKAFFETSPRQHSAPEETCDCGIYGSVNLEEVAVYFASVKWLPPNPYNSEKEKKTLCIVEPSPDAKVILCRKGWRTSKAFISEVIGETISIEDASQLLSMAWHRTIDVGKVYRRKHENW